jgi:predicted HicB family RNase H-like nuclease
MAYSEAQKKASMKYNKKNYERIYMYVFPQEKEEWQAAAKNEDISLSEFIKRCVNEKISHDKGRQ